MVLVDSSENTSSILSSVERLVQNTTWTRIASTEDPRITNPTMSCPPISAEYLPSNKSRKPERSTHRITITTTTTTTTTTRRITIPTTTTTTTTTTTRDC